MATYVATNVQNFPDPNPDPTIVLGVQAQLSQAAPDGGVMLSSWRGVDAVSAQPVGAHSSASGSGSSTTTAHPGAIAGGSGGFADAPGNAGAGRGGGPPAAGAPPPHTS